MSADLVADCEVEPTKTQLKSRPWLCRTLQTVSDDAGKCLGSGHTINNTDVGLCRGRWQWYQLSTVQDHTVPYYVTERPSGGGPAQHVRKTRVETQRHASTSKRPPLQRPHISSRQAWWLETPWLRAWAIGCPVVALGFRASRLQSRRLHTAAFGHQCTTHQRTNAPMRPGTRSPPSRAAGLPLTRDHLLLTSPHPGTRSPSSCRPRTAPTTAKTPCRRATPSAATCATTTRRSTCSSSTATPGTRGIS